MSTSTDNQTKSSNASIQQRDGQDSNALVTAAAQSEVKATWTHHTRTISSSSADAPGSDYELSPSADVGPSYRHLSQAEERESRDTQSQQDNCSDGSKKSASLTMDSSNVEAQSKPETTATQQNLLVSQSLSDSQTSTMQPKTDRVGQDNCGPSSSVRSSSQIKRESDPSLPSTVVQPLPTTTTDHISVPDKTFDQDSNLLSDGASLPSRTLSAHVQSKETPLTPQKTEINQSKNSSEKRRKLSSRTEKPKSLNNAEVKQSKSKNVETAIASTSLQSGSSDLSLAQRRWKRDNRDRESSLASYTVSPGSASGSLAATSSLGCVVTHTSTPSNPLFRLPPDLPASVMETPPNWHPPRLDLINPVILEQNHHHYTVWTFWDCMAPVGKRDQDLVIYSNDGVAFPCAAWNPSIYSQVVREVIRTPIAEVADFWNKSWAQRKQKWGYLPVTCLILDEDWQATNLLLSFLHPVPTLYLADRAITLKVLGLGVRYQVERAVTTCLQRLKDLEARDKNEAEARARARAKE